MALMACGGSADTDRAQTDDIGGDITTEQAQQWAVEAAKAIAESDHNDTLDMQHHIIDAHAKRSRLMMADNQDAIEAFDKSLREELQRIDPDIAHEIFPDKK